MNPKESAKKGKILILDVGEKTIGVAATDETRLLVTPLPPIVRVEGALSLGKIKRLLEEHNPTLLVMGFPLNMDGTKGHMTRKIQGFAGKLKKHFPTLLIEFSDERLSSWSARKDYSHLHLKKGVDAKNIDSFAAMEIASRYLEETKMTEFAQGGLWGSSLLMIKKIDSTNTFLKNSVENYPHGTVARALVQTAGRGRFERSWAFTPGKSLAFSILFDIPNQELWGNVAQVVALSVASATKELGLTPTIKWPNDLLINEKKFCGILTESVLKEGSYKLICGVGINVNNDSKDLKVADKVVTSLSHDLEKEVELEAFLATTLLKIEENVTLLLEKNFEPFVAEFDSLMLKNRVVVHHAPQQQKELYILGVASNGKLLARTGDNPEHSEQIVQIDWGEIEL